VKQGDVLFRVLPTLYQARLDAELAEVQLALQEYNNNLRLFNDKVVSQNDLLLYAAKLAKARAKAALAQAELNFATVTARFDGIIDRLYQMQGSLVGKGDLLTTLSDNSLMWVYFNVPEARYLEYRSLQSPTTNNSQLELVDSKIELILANGGKFNQDPGNVVTVEGQFDNKTGNIQFRADFPNPNRLLRHGQTGTVLIRRRLRHALVIPQRATFEILDKRYVWVIGEDHVAHQRLITIKNELEDIFVVNSGLDVNDKIVLEGVRQVRDGDKIEDYEFRKPEAALQNQKFPAE
jgi:membrane fusion protein (multidrug efflux system)